MTQFMGDLPSTRVIIPEHPFYNSAVDYTGAFFVKSMNGRGERVGRHMLPFSYAWPQKPYTPN